MVTFAGIARITWALPHVYAQSADGVFRSRYAALFSRSLYTPGSRGGGHCEVSTLVLWLISVNLIQTQWGEFPALTSAPDNTGVFPPAHPLSCSGEPHLIPKVSLTRRICHLWIHCIPVARTLVPQPVSSPTGPIAFDALYLYVYLLC